MRVTSRTRDMDEASSPIIDAMPERTDAPPLERVDAREIVDPVDDTPVLPARLPRPRISTVALLKRFMPRFMPTTFVLFVIVPSLIAQIYFLFIASNQYEATARFAVRAAIEDTNKSSNGSSALTGAGSVTSVSMVSQDAYMVVSYIQSRAILDDLAPKLSIRDIFQRPEADAWARLSKTASSEKLLDYWKSMVTTSVDGPSGIVTVYVHTFRREDSLHLLQAIVQASETLVNNVSLRARADALERAEKEVRGADGQVRQALADMLAWRQSVGFIDPVAMASVTSRQIAQLVVEKIELENTIFVGSRTMSPDAPTLTSSKIRLQSVNDQIDKLKQTLTGAPGTKSLSQALVKFEELELKRVFAEKMYTIAQDSMERARIIAQRQNVFVDLFVPPSLPDEALFPERIPMAIVIPICLIIVWSIFALLVATVDDHRI